MTIIRLPLALVLIGGLSACFGNKAVDYTCDEPQRYQAVTDGRRIVSPEGLDTLNEFAEMPIPSAEGAPVRPAGSPCIELPPSVQTGG